MFVYNVGLSSSSSSLEGRVLADGVEDKRSASPSPLLRSFGVPSFGEENSRNAKRGATRGRRRQTSSFPLRGKIISLAQTRFLLGKNEWIASYISMPCRLKFV